MKRQKGTSCYVGKCYRLCHISLRKEQKNEEIHGKPLPSYQKNLNVARAVRELLIEITIQRGSKSMWHFSWSISVIQKACRTYLTAWLRQNLTFRMKKCSQNFSLNLNHSWNFINMYLLSRKFFVTVCYTIFRYILFLTILKLCISFTI